MLSIRFDSVTDVELEGFGMQNVLFDLHLEAVEPEAGQSRLAVDLQSSFNLSGAFDCAKATLMSADLAPTS